jgi:hypothetical protein
LAGALLLLTPLQPAWAQVHAHDDENGQEVVRSLESLRDLDYQSWQAVAYRTGPPGGPVTLRIVGYPGRVRLDHPTPLLVTSGRRLWELADLTLANPKLAGDGMADEQVFCAEAGGVEGEQIAGMEKFRADFKAKFGADVQVYAPYVYDAVHVMAKAMVNANSADPVKYLPALKAIEHKGVTGNIAFDEKGDIKNGALTLKTYKGGERTTLAVIR